jgi:hypothetical protein
MATPENPARMRWEMFALSFTALFLEMMVIRWVPSVVHLVAYYANLMLLSSFLGLGAGAMAAGRKWNLFGWFPVLLACQIGNAAPLPQRRARQLRGEARFYQLAPSTLNGIVLVWIFATNARCSCRSGRGWASSSTRCPACRPTGGTSREASRGPSASASSR